MEVEAVASEVTEEEIAAELERLQQRHAELSVIEEGAAENGDITVIDFDGYVDGEPFEGGKASVIRLSLVQIPSSQASRSKLSACKSAISRTLK